MKLDRNNPDSDGKGKYALLLMRELEGTRTGPFRTLPKDVEAAITLLHNEGLLDFGEVDTESEFFVIRLKDHSAEQALRAYGEHAHARDPEWAREVWELATRAKSSPWKKEPD